MVRGSFEKGRTGGWGRRAVVAAALVGAGFPLVAGIAHGQTPDPFLPDTVLTPPRSPRVVHLRADGAPVVALRLSIPFREAPGEAGAGRLLQILGVERAQGRATAVGASVEGTRTPWGIAYTVVGPASDIDYLAYLLREATAEPTEGRISFAGARAALMEEVRHHDETPRGRIETTLRAQSAPGVPPLWGDVGSLRAMTESTLRQLWARTHQPERMTLVAAGDVPQEVILASLQGIGVTPGTESARPDGPAPPPDRNRVQILRHWYGEAHTVVDGRDPRSAVAALVLAEHLRGRADDFESEVQLWETDGRRVIALIGAAYSRASARMRQVVGGAMGTAAGSLDDETVERAVRNVRRELLMSARTPRGRVAFVGRHLDATGDPSAARSYVRALEDVTSGSLRDFMTTLGGRTPVRAEVRP